MLMLIPHIAVANSFISPKAHTPEPSQAARTRARLLLLQAGDLCLTGITAEQEPQDRALAEDAKQLGKGDGCTSLQQRPSTLLHTIKALRSIQCN